MTVVHPTALDALAGAIGQMNLHGTAPTPGSGVPLQAVEDTMAADSKASSQVKTDGQNDDDELADVEEEISYKAYHPAKLTYGRDHPDKVVENATLAAVAPPDISYNLAMP